MDKFMGKLCRDKVTGFIGIVTGRAEYIYGCNQYVLVPRVDKDGKPSDANWYDEGRLEIIGDGVTEKKVTGKKPGGPQPLAPSIH